ncbi:hypothetical protein N7492_007999 [Penicillium capsulatum]|uniref:Uncharacterized protein n=1 Tax=Penicillium capsulatum TaxID=69766 RepID=A0A9W9HSM1_9EURO|nr:hypothetical protein N7492_007999 [Penicillium capsulatum]KAJ6105406.1 hypothetical protein N7512_008923 [Penicillium capsulatum]
MKFLLSLAAFAGMALAQSAGLGLPTEGQEIAAGSQVVVQVQRPNSPTPSKEMAVAIGIAPCSSNGCQSSSDVLGTIMYNGPFSPAYHDSSPPYENFTVKIPDDLAEGKAKLNIAHATLIGAGPFPFLETLNRTVVITKGKN